MEPCGNFIAISFLYMIDTGLNTCSYHSARDMLRCAHLCRDLAQCRSFSYSSEAQKCCLGKDTSLDSTKTKPLSGAVTYLMYQGLCNKEGYVWFLNYCYKLETIDLTGWIGADEICTKEGGRLAVLNTDIKYKYTVEFLGANDVKTEVSIGARKLGDRWKWVDGSALTYTNWGELGIVPEGCMVLRYGTMLMTDSSCTVVRAYLCEIPL